MTNYAVIANMYIAKDVVGKCVSFYIFTMDEHVF